MLFGWWLRVGWFEATLGLDKREGSSLLVLIHWCGKRHVGEGGMIALS